MNHRLKGAVFRALSLLPRSLGDALYERLHAWRNRGDLRPKLARCRESFEEIARLVERQGGSLANAEVVEIGAGWVPALPYLLCFEGGARKVTSYDVAAHLRQSEVERFNELFFSAAALERPALGEWALASGVEYRPNTDLAEHPPEAPVDLVLSRFVLEHVPPEQIVAMHRALRTCLRADSLVVHLVSPSDHRSYGDPSLSLYDFLRFSQDQWRRKHTRFDYHNRLRLPQYRELFAHAGFEVVEESYVSSSTDERLAAQLDRVAVHEDFARFTREELSAGSLVFGLRATG